MALNCLLIIIKVIQKTSHFDIKKKMIYCGSKHKFPSLINYHA